MSWSAKVSIFPKYSEACLDSITFASIPNSFSACCNPSHADWLNDSSFIPPTSATIPTFIVLLFDSSLLVLLEHPTKLIDATIKAELNATIFLNFIVIPPSVFIIVIIYKKFIWMLILLVFITNNITKVQRFFILIYDIFLIFFILTIFFIFNNIFI